MFRSSVKGDSFALLDNITMCGREVGSFEEVWLDIILEIRFSGVAKCFIGETYIKEIRK